MTDIPYNFEDNVNFDIYMSGGRQLPAAPANGLYLQRIDYSDGTAATVKVVK